MRNSEHGDLEAAVRSAEELWRQGRFREALEAYREILRTSLEARRAADLGAAHLVVIERLADLAVLFGYVEAADKLLEAMVMLCREVDNRYAADYIALKRVHIALARGALRVADHRLQEMQATIGDIREIDFTRPGLDGWEAARHWPGTSTGDRAVLFTRLYLGIGWLLACLGQYGQAFAALRRGLAYATPPDAPDLARQAAPALRLACATVRIECGDLIPALEELAALKTICLEGRQPGYAVRWLELDGQIAMLQGDYGRALKRSAEVCQRCRTGGFVQAELRALLNQSQVFIFLNQIAAAMQMLDAAQEYAKTIGDPTMRGRVALLRRLALARSQSLADGVPIAPSVIELWTGTRSRPQPPQEITVAHPLDLPQATQYLTFFDDRALGFHWLIAEYDIPAAQQALDLMRQVFQDTDSDLIQTRLYLLGGMLAYYAGNIAAAASIFAATLPALTAMGLHPERWQTQRFLGWCWAKLDHPEAERLALTASTDQLLTLLTDSLDGSDRAIFLLNKWTAQEEAFAARANELARLKRQAETGTRLLRPWRRFVLNRRLAALLQDIDRDKDRRVRKTMTGDDTTSSQRPTAFWRMLLNHPRDRATMSFLVLPDRVLIIRVDRRGLDFGISPLTRIQVRTLVRQWHESVRRLRVFTRNHNGDPAPSNDAERGIYLIPAEEQEENTSEHAAKQRTLLHEQQRTIAAQLANDLQLPALLNALPPHIHALTIVPDDSLHGFPFAAIMVKDRYLIERYRLRVAFEHRNRPGSAPAIPQHTGLLVGVSRGTPRFAPLPGTLRELVKVRTWLRQQQFPSQHLINQHASRAAVLAHLPSATLAHIACHGVFALDRPDQSGLVMLPQLEQVEILSLRDLATLNLSGLQHVTLSACWSADNFILPGRQIISLPETLWRSGVGSILGSLWEVQDRHAIKFMERFYHYVTNSPRDEALRRTQLDWLNGNLPGQCADDPTDPSYWAGFVLYGDHTSLVLPGSIPIPSTLF